MRGGSIRAHWPTATARRLPPGLAAAFAVLAACLAALAVNALFGVGENRSAQLVREWLSSVIYVVVAIIVAARAISIRSKRRAWTLLALGLSLYALGNVLWSFWIGRLANAPIPSICDMLWLSLYPLSYIGIIDVARERGEHEVAAGVWLDGIITGGGLAAIGAALVFGHVVASVQGSPSAVATELAYPIGDLILAGLVVGVLALRGWRLDRVWGLLGAGFLLLSLGDCLYAVQVADGSRAPSSMTNFVYVLAVALLACAAWQPDGRPRESRTHAAWWLLLVPGGFTLAALGLLVVDHFLHLDPLAFGLSIATLLAAVARMGVAFADVRQVMRARVASERRRAEAEHEKRALQERLQRAQRLEAVGALAAGVAHDFNNMLAVIVNYVDLIRGELPEDSQAREDVDEIAGVAARAARLTGQLLTFGQRKVGTPERLDVQEVFHSMRDMLERSLGADVALHCACDDDLWPVDGDRSDIEQIVLNLVVNARDAVGTGGSISASVANVEFDEDEADERELVCGRYVRISVTDDGCGIDADTLARVWEPFFTTKAPGSGTGLGLSTVYGIARQAGGGVAIESVAGRGTCVEVCLPVAGAPERHHRKPAPRADSGERASILLVDDDAAVRDAVRMILEHAGYRVLSAEHPEKALALLSAAGRCDLLLTPVLIDGGWAADLTARAQQLVPSLRTLFVSSYADRFLHAGRRADVGPLITKPIQADVLLRHVSELIGAPTGRAAAVPS